MSTEVFRVHGGILNGIMFPGQLRFFKIVGDFAWTVSDGTVNLPPRPITPLKYTVTNVDAPVPYSAAEYVLREIATKCEIVSVALTDGSALATYGDTTELHIACTTHNFGWTDDAEMQTFVQALPSVDVYITSGAAVPPATQDSRVPVTSTVSFGGVTVTEVDFVLV